MWILISWLHQKPADLDLHCFQQKVYKVEKSYVNSIRLNTVSEPKDVAITMLSIEVIYPYINKSITHQIVTVMQPETHQLIFTIQTLIKERMIQ